MSTTITLTNEETANLIGTLGHISDNLHDRLCAYGDDPEFVKIYQPMIDIIDRIQELITDTTTAVVEVAERPCDKCGAMVSEFEYHGHDKPDGTTEYLCGDCPSDYCVDCGGERWYSKPDARYYHVDVERECFLTIGKAKDTA